jgi:hypothetical protein
MRPLFRLYIPEVTITKVQKIHLHLRIDIQAMLVLL